MKARKIATAPRRAARAAGRGLKAFSQMVFGRSAGIFGRWFLPRTRFDYEAEVGDGLGSSVLMAPVLWMCRTFPEAPVQVLDEDSAPVEPHEMLKLLRRPNPHYSGKVLWKATLASWTLSGNAYWLKVWNRAGSSVKQLWFVPHCLIEPKAPEDATTPRPAGSKLADEFVSHYEYTVDGQVIPLRIEDVVHFRDGLDPRNPRKGLSPLASLFREVFTDDEAANFSAALLKNLGVPGLLISPEGEHKPSEDDVKATKDYVDEEFTGDRRGKPMTMSGPTKVQQFGFNPAQMDLSKLRGIPEERVSAVLGIPAAVVGFGSGLAQTKVGATMRELREMAYESAVIPTQDLMAEELRHQLLPDFGEAWERQEVAFDLSRVRVLQEDQNKLAERAGQLYKDGVVTRAEARADLRMEAEDADEVYAVPLNVTLLGADERLMLGPGEAPDNGGTEGEGKGLKGRARPLAKQAATEGAMVALYPESSVAEELAQEGGEPAEDIHLTLAFLTADASEIEDPERLRTVVEGFAATAPPLSGRVSGVGHFSGGPEPVTYASADLPHLPDVRQRLVEALALAGFPPSAEHGFTPHLTLAYAEIDPDLPDELPLSFDTLTLRLGEQRHDFPLTGTEPKRRGVPRTTYTVKSRPADPDDYKRGLVLIVALERDQKALAAAFARELEPELAAIGRAAAETYAERAAAGLASRNGDGAKADEDEGDEEIAAAAAAAAALLARERLPARFEAHWRRAAATTEQTIESLTELGAEIPDRVANDLAAKGAERTEQLSLLDQAAIAAIVLAAMHDGREEEESPAEIAGRIRHLVPAGRFAVAGVAYRAGLIAAAETVLAQRLASLAAYGAADGVSEVIAYDNRTGFDDTECTERDGRVFSFAEANREAIAEHPRGTLLFAPRIAPAPAELVPA